MIVKRKYDSIKDVVSETFTHEKSILHMKDFWHAQEVPHVIFDDFFREGYKTEEPFLTGHHAGIEDALKEKCFTEVLQDITGLPSLHKIPDSHVVSLSEGLPTFFRNNIAHPGTFWSRLMLEIQMTSPEKGGEFEMLRDSGSKTELLYRVPERVGRAILTYIQPDTYCGRRPIEKGHMETIHAVYATHEPPEWRDQGARPATIKREAVE